jgi:hypothetical protein
VGSDSNRTRGAGSVCRSDTAVSTRRASGGSLAHAVGMGLPDGVVERRSWRCDRCHSLPDQRVSRCNTGNPLTGPRFVRKRPPTEE